MSTSGTLVSFHFTHSFKFAPENPSQTVVCRSEILQNKVNKNKRSKAKRKPKKLRHMGLIKVFDQHMLLYKSDTADLHGIQITGNLQLFQFLHVPTRRLSQGRGSSLWCEDQTRGFEVKPTRPLFLHVFPALSYVRNKILSTELECPSKTRKRTHAVSRERICALFVLALTVGL